tara:strand:+ start:690 stop:854 length:165 start_codon:yes stop_codon:yes gene_type:complete
MRKEEQEKKNNVFDRRNYQLGGFRKLQHAEGFDRHITGLTVTGVAGIIVDYGLS